MSLKERIEGIKEKARQSAVRILDWCEDHEEAAQGILAFTAAVAILGTGIAVGKKSGREKGFREGVEAVVPEIHVNVLDGQTRTDKSDPDPDPETNIYKF